jgi:hypothetical protein
VFKHLQAAGARLNTLSCVVFSAAQHVAEYGPTNPLFFEKVAGLFYQVNGAHDAAVDVQLISGRSGEGVSKRKAKPFF